MSNPILVKSYTAGEAVEEGRIVCFGNADGVAVKAAAATDALIGVAYSLPAASGERLDVMIQGIADVMLGGTVARGDFITSDANGKGVKADPAAAVNCRALGVALESGASGEIIPVLLGAVIVQGEGVPA
ncbi:MAG: DUF2190 family protein [Magnetococcales bacterium]|nr:DUF2190 family protein [Magnetococcales bacterium]